MGPPVTLPSSLVGIREAIKGNSDSEEMQRTATAGFYAGFVGQGLEYVQIISKADYQLSLLIVTQKGLNAAANPLTYVEYFRNFSPQEKLEAAKRTAKGAWNGEYDSALGRKTGAATLDYLLVAIGGALMKGESAACEVAESGNSSIHYGELDSLGRATGVDATITVDMVGTGTPAKSSIKPAGFGGQKAGHARGHLLGNQLGGAGDDPRNLTTLFQNPVNHPVMSSVEGSVRKAVEAGEVVQYSVKPIYEGNTLIPSGVTIKAEGDKGFYIYQTILNRK